MNFNVIDQAIKLVRDKFKINFVVSNYTIQMDPDDITIDGIVHYRREPELKMTLTVTEDHGSWNEYTDLDYVIFDSDLRDGSIVDDVIGGNIKGYDLDMRQALRLAFIIYNGIQYGAKRMQRKDYTDKGWRPRVVSVKMRY